MSMSVVEDIVQYMETERLGVRGRDLFTEADLNKWKGRTQAVIVTGRNQPREPEVTASVDYHGLTVSIVDGYGEQGMTKSAARAHEVYMCMRLGINITIDGTFYPCIRAVSSPRVVAVDTDGKMTQTQHDFDLEVTRYYGD